MRAFAVPPADEIASTPYYFGKKAVTFLPKQWELCFAPEPEIASVGGYGSSKTFGGVTRATRLLSWYPGNLGLIGRYASTDLAGTTRNDCLEFWEDANLLEDFVEKSRKYKVPTATIRCVDPYTQEILKNKYSDAIFVHFDDPTHIHGYHAGFIWMDEANECTKMAYNKAMSRLRRKGFEGLYSLWVTSNTDLGYDWIWEHFFDKETLAKLKAKRPKSFDSRRAIHSTTYENRKNLPPDYIENMENSYSEKMQRVYLGGSYESFEGQMYEEWSEETHVFNYAKCFPNGIPEDWTRLLAIDPGGTDPWAFEFAALDPWHNVLLYDEIYGSGSRVAPFAAAALPKIKPYKRWKAKVIDSENKVVAGELADYGIVCTNAQKQNKIGDKNSSFFRLSGYLHPNKEHAHPDWHPRKGQAGSPRMFVADRCVELRKEFPQQRWRRERATGRMLNEPDPNVPNHGTDCAMYIVRELPKPTELSKTLISDLGEMSVMGKIMNFERRFAKEQEKKRKWNALMGHGGRWSGRRSNLRMA